MAFVCFDIGYAVEGFADEGCGFAGHAEAGGCSFSSRGLFHLLPGPLAEEVFTVSFHADFVTDFAAEGHGGVLLCHGVKVRGCFEMSWERF